MQTWDEHRDLTKAPRTVKQQCYLLSVLLCTGSESFARSPMGSGRNLKSSAS